MDCIKCGTVMFTASAEGAMAVPLYLSKKEKGIFGAERRTTVDCFVCPGCGYIELRAKDAASLLIPGGNYGTKEDNK